MPSPRRLSATSQSGKEGVDLAVALQELRTQSQVGRANVREVAGRKCLDVGGVWIDEGFDPQMPTLVVKAQSDAYFRILERNPKLKDVYQLGNHLVWVTPNGTALVIVTHDAALAGRARRLLTMRDGTIAEETIR